MKKIDTSGLSCPQPVLLVLQCIKAEQPDAIEVVVDNEASLENVTRAAGHNGYAVEQNVCGENTLLTLTKK